MAPALGGLTPLYASPEVFDGRPSVHSDQYSLAVVYQELLTGTRPFPGGSVQEIILQHLQADPDLSALPHSDRPAVAREIGADGPGVGAAHAGRTALTGSGAP